MRKVDRIVTDFLPEYDRKCKHNKVIDTQPCLECYPDLSWIDVPVTEEEWRIAIQERYYNHRPSPCPRQCRYGYPITYMILKEYGRLKGWTA